MRKKLYKISWMFVLMFVIFGVLPFWANAQSLNLSAPKTSYNFGDSFLVSLSINTKNKAINTISGVIKFPADKLRVTETRYGNSIITLWVERPAINASVGTITFSGGVPGGFNGSSGPILSFVAKSLKTGTVSVSLENVNVLLNDGLGTILNNVSLGKLNVTVSKAPASIPKKEEPKIVYVPPPDMVPPESFTPMVSRHPSVADNNFFVSFFAVDKDSGVARYEIKEKPLILSYFTSRFDMPWVSAESPYVISRQFLSRDIIVRAYDQAGNFTEERVLKPMHPYLMAVFAGVWTLIVIAASHFYFKPKTIKRTKARTRSRVL